jgi:EF hand domain-containing protein
MIAAPCRSGLAQRGAEPNNTAMTIGYPFSGSLPSTGRAREGYRSAEAHSPASLATRVSAHSIAALVCFGWVSLAGCAPRPSAVAPPSVNAGDAARFSMEHYDANHDGAIDAAELALCPPLVVALARYDMDKNGQLSAEEIETRITQLYGPGAALINVDCTVSLNGRPLRGATVKFHPVEMLTPSIKLAQGVTDDSGVALMAMGDEDLPNDLKGAQLMRPGLYHVEITHPKLALPTRYNTATKLGFEVDPSQRGGTSARFDLKSK